MYQPGSLGSYTLVGAGYDSAIRVAYVVQSLSLQLNEWYVMRPRVVLLDVVLYCQSRCTPRIGLSVAW